MNVLKRHIWTIAAALLCGLATIYIWGPLVTDPGNSLIESGGDAGKNYFVYLYHIIYGSGAWFRGMNYPFGEHIVYTDAQPLLSVALSYLPGVDFQVALTVMHLLLMLGFVLGLIFVYKTLVHFRVHPAVAIFASLLILIMSPQVEKVFGHFGLSYMCVIPMLLYWSVKYREQHRYQYPFYLFLLGCTVSFLHPYLGGVVFMWTLFYACGYLLVELGSVKAKLKHVSPMLLAALSVVVLVKLIMAITDPVPDRPEYPTGILSYVTTIDDVFGFLHSPLSRFFNRHNLLVVTNAHEGSTYPGAVALIAVLVSFVIISVQVLMKHKSLTVLNRPSFSPLWLLMALLALLLAMGLPFVWHMEWLIDHVSLFRQFRTLGRFSWIFYYIVTVYAVVIIYHWFMQQKANNRILAFCVVAMATLVWSFEAAGYVKNIRARLVPALYNNYSFLSRVERSWDIYLQDEGYTVDSFQAAFTIPFTHIGSEKIALQRDDRDAWLQSLGWRVSVQTGLPMVNAFMSRSSWAQTFQQVRLAGSPYADKPLFRVKDERPFLLLKMETDSITNPDEQYLVENSEFIGAHGDLKAYKLYPVKIRTIDSTYKAKALQSAAAMLPGDTCLDSRGPWYVNHYNEEPGKQVLFGTGALPSPESDTVVLADITFNVPDSAGRYECSAWVLVNSIDYRTSHLLLEYYHHNKQLLGRDIVHVSRAVDNHNMWLRASGLYTFPAGCASIRWKWIEGNTAVALDELMIRPVGATIISRAQNGAVMVNNHLLTPR